MLAFIWILLISVSLETPSLVLLFDCKEGHMSSCWLCDLFLNTNRFLPLIPCDKMASQTPCPVSCSVFSDESKARSSCSHHPFYGNKWSSDFPSWLPRLFFMYLFHKHGRLFAVELPVWIVRDGSGMSVDWGRTGHFLWDGRTPPFVLTFCLFPYEELIEIAVGSLESDSRSW